MLDRMAMIGEIRDFVRDLWDQGKFALAQEILGDIHPDNFSGVNDYQVAAMYFATLTLDEYWGV